MNHLEIVLVTRSCVPATKAAGLPYLAVRPELHLDGHPLCACSVSASFTALYVSAHIEGEHGLFSFGASSGAPADGVWVTHGPSTVCWTFPKSYYAWLAREGVAARGPALEQSFRFDRTEYASMMARHAQALEATRVAQGLAAVRDDGECLPVLRAQRYAQTLAHAQADFTERRVLAMADTGRSDSRANRQPTHEASELQGGLMRTRKVRGRYDE